MADRGSVCGSKKFQELTTEPGKESSEGNSAIARGADGNRYRSGGGVGRGEHVAASVENSSGVNHHTGRMYFSRDDALGLNLDAAFRENHAVKAAGNDHAVSFDLTLDFCAVAENDRLLGNDISLHVAIDAERALDRQRSFETYALINESGPLFAVRTVVFPAARPLPRHIELPQIS